jgi:hypothetical protein
LLPLLNPPVRVRRKTVSHHLLRPCSSNSKLGRPRKMHGRGSGPHSPYKMPRSRLCKMPKHLTSPCKSTEGSGPYKIRGRRSDMCRSLEQRSSGSKMHGYRSGPYKMLKHKMHEHRPSPCRMPRHRRSCKASTHLEQARPSVVLEQLGIPDVAAQRIDRLVAAHVHHLED